MRIRYYRNASGGLQAKARVFDQTEHAIDVAGVDREAITIVKRLASHGYSAYIVGGAVRDLLLGNRPKDFDIVTDALPNRIRKIFSNSRIIGRRFKLVHVYANRKIYEVSTFRSLSTGTIGNEYGTIDEDVQRRDFTVNALYYDPLASEVLDFLGGVDDLRSKRLKAIIPLDRIFREDPVRMVRGVKYAAVNHFLVSISLRFAIHRDAALLTEVSPSRLAEEFYKIIASGKSAAVIQALDKFGLLQYLLPEVYASIHGDKTFREAFFQNLSSLDLSTQAPEDTSLLNSASAAEIVQSDRRLISPFLGWFIRQRLRSFAKQENVSRDPPLFRREAFSDIRAFLAPLNLPRIALEEAMEQVLREDDLLPAPLPPKRRKRGPRRKKPKLHAESAHLDMPDVNLQ
ncbi:MAG: polynucleotide adenylyltransferase PcnB [Rectinema sp.]